MLSYLLGKCPFTIVRFSQCSSMLSYLLGKCPFTIGRFSQWSSMLSYLLGKCPFTIGRFSQWSSMLSYLLGKCPFTGGSFPSDPARSLSLYLGKVHSPAVSKVQSRINLPHLSTVNTSSRMEIWTRSSANQQQASKIPVLQQFKETEITVCPSHFFLSLLCPSIQSIIFSITTVPITSVSHCFPSRLLWYYRLIQLDSWKLTNDTSLSFSCFCFSLSLAYCIAPPPPPPPTPTPPPGCSNVYWDSATSWIQDHLSLLKEIISMLPLTAANFIRSVLTVDFPITLVAGRHTLVTALTHELVHSALFAWLLCSWRE